MVNLLFVGIGSAFGGIVRYWIGLHVKSGGSFPIATCIVNLFGSLLIGLLSGLLERSYSQSSLAPMIRSFAVIGFCGGFTTFSTFSNEIFRMLHHSQYGAAFLYLSISILAGLGAVFAGYAIAKSVG